MTQKTKRIYRTVKEPACVSKNVTVREAEKAAKECKKKKTKNYLLTFDYYDRSGEDSTVLRTLKNHFLQRMIKKQKI